MGGRLERTRLVARRLRTDLEHARGEGRRWLAGDPRGPEAVLVVLGCQRSGTTLMTQILGADPGAKVYPEHSALSAGDRRNHLRLGDYRDTARRVAASRFPLVVLKPLVESQHAAALLDALPRARGLWMYRHYADVVRSNLARFGEGNGVRNLRSIATRRSDDWRSEGVSEAVAKVVAQHFHDAMSAWDAAAMFWWARNALFFEQELGRRDDLRTCRYEELVADPARVVRGIYAFAGVPYPGDGVLAGVSDRSVGRGREVALSPEVRELCEAMLERLDAAHREGGSCAPRAQSEGGPCASSR